MRHGEAVCLNILPHFAIFLSTFYHVSLVSCMSLYLFIIFFFYIIISLSCVSIISYHHHHMCIISVYLQSKSYWQNLSIYISSYVEGRAISYIQYACIQYLYLLIYNIIFYALYVYLFCVYISSYIYYM